MSSETLNTAGAFSQAKDLKNRILFTILILIVWINTYDFELIKLNKLAWGKSLRFYFIGRNSKNFLIKNIFNLA